jgi:hypothetical protein
LSFGARMRGKRQRGHHEEGEQAAVDAKGAAAIAGD